MNEPLAHSARVGAPVLTYRSHVSEVLRLALVLGGAASAFSPKWRESFLASLELAASCHDLGKLDKVFQDDLRHSRRKTGLNHVDAGTAHLLKGRHAEAAVAVYAHHIGLPSFPDEIAKNANGLAGMFRDLDGDVAATGLKTHQRTDENLVRYLEEHTRLLLSPDFQTQPFRGIRVWFDVFSCRVWWMATILIRRVTMRTSTRSIRLNCVPLSGLKLWTGLLPDLRSMPSRRPRWNA